MFFCPCFLMLPELFVIVMDAIFDACVYLAYFFRIVACVVSVVLVLLYELSTVLRVLRGPDLDTFVGFPFHIVPILWEDFRRSLVILLYLYWCYAYIIFPLYVAHFAWEWLSYHWSRFNKHLDVIRAGADWYDLNLQSFCEMVYSLGCLLFFYCLVLFYFGVVAPYLTCCFLFTFWWLVRLP